MQPITINPFIKFGFLVGQIMLLIITGSNFIGYFIIVFSGLYLAFKRVAPKVVWNGMKFGILLTIFMFVFSYLRYQNITVALVTSYNLIVMYGAMIIISCAYKFNTTNKEVAYVLSVILSPLTIIGFNQNKLYTLFLMVLNQIFTMRKSSLRIYQYGKYRHQGKLTIKQIIILIAPFINNNLKQNELLAIGLLNSGYNSECKRLKPYFIVDYKLTHLTVLVAIIVFEIGYLI